jgi:hypothetical protein
MAEHTTARGLTGTSEGTASPPSSPSAVTTSCGGGGLILSLMSLVTLSMHSEFASELPPNFIVTSMAALRGAVDPGRRSNEMRRWFKFER